jgi:hypothetical protein
MGMPNRGSNYERFFVVVVDWDAAPDPPAADHLPSGRAGGLPQPSQRDRHH